MIPSKESITARIFISQIPVVGSALKARMDFLSQKTAEHHWHKDFNMGQIIIRMFSHLIYMGKEQRRKTTISIYC